MQFYVRSFLLFIKATLGIKANLRAFGRSLQKQLRDMGTGRLTLKNRYNLFTKCNLIPVYFDMTESSITWTGVCPIPSHSFVSLLT